MNAWGLVASWTEERARGLRLDADRARVAYTKDPMAVACRRYAQSLDAAAAILEVEARAHRGRSERMTSSAPITMLLVPRVDIRPEENCFDAIGKDGKRIGFVQIFKDGTAGYWRKTGDQARPAPSPELAYAALQRGAES